MSSAEPMEELLGKMNALKIRMNLRQTKILVFGTNMRLPNSSGMDLCSILQTGVSSNAIFCRGCLY